MISRAVRLLAIGICAFALHACGGARGSNAAAPGVLPNIAQVIPTIRPSAAIVAPNVVPSTAPAPQPTPSIDAPAVLATIPPALIPPPAATPAAVVPVHFSFSLAGSTARTGSAHMRLRQFISPSNTLISITVTPFGGSGTVYGPTACTSGTCAINFTATPGPNTIVFTLTDGSANVLSRFSTTTIVQPATVNTLKFSANPVVNSVSLSLASSSVNAGTPANVVLTVNAKDAANNTIVGNDNYVDVNGNPLALTLDVTNNQAGGSGTASIGGATRIVNPSSVSYVRYDGGWLQSSTINVRTSGAVASLSGVTLSTAPRVFEYAASGTPSAIVAAPDGKLWVALFASNLVGRINIDGTGYTTFPCTPCFSLSYLTVGADGALWIPDINTNGLFRMTTAGISTKIASLSGGGIRARVGPDGAIWVANDPASGSPSLQRITYDGKVTTYSSTVGYRGIAFGNDGNAWITTCNDTGYRAQCNASSVRKISTSGKLLQTVALPNTGAAPDGSILGPDGAIWLTNYGSSEIDRIAPNGTPTSYALQTGAQPRDIVVGPDGKLWFSEPGKDSIGSLSTGGGPPTEYGLAQGIASGSAPQGIVVGPDGNIWFTESGSGKIAKFVL